MPQLNRVTPFLRVPDIEAAIAFFRDTLEFQLEFNGGDYACLRRDRVAFRMVQDRALPPKGGGRYTAYVDVDDVDGLYAQLKPKLDRLPAAWVIPPCDQEYGQREFAVVGPDGDLIAFGMPIAAD